MAITIAMVLSLRSLAIMRICCIQLVIILVATFTVMSSKEGDSVGCSWYTQKDRVSVKWDMTRDSVATRTVPSC